MAVRHFRYKLRCLGHRVRIRWNGVTELELVDGRPCALDGLADGWLASGRNHLEIHLASGTPPPPLEDEPPDFEFALYRSEPWESKPYEVDVVVAYRFRPETALLHEGRLESVIDHRFFVEAAAGTWAWERGTPYVPAEEGPVRTMVEMLRRSIKAKSYKQIVELTKIRTTELALAAEQDREAVETGTFEELLDLFSEDDFALVEPLDYTLEPTWDGRLVVVRAADGFSPIRAKAGHRQWSLPIALSRIEGQWMIVR